MKLIAIKKSLIFFLFASFFGCGSSAIIHLKNGKSIEAKITDSDYESVYITAGYDKEIPRSQIVDIDHPGNVLATIGGLFVLTGAQFWYIGSETKEYVPGAFSKGMGLISLISGGLMSIYGISVWNRSRKNASKTYSHYAYTKDDSLIIQPKFYHNNNESYQGLSIMYQY